jgi:tellurite resistance-related uncharacterized protein
MRTLFFLLICSALSIGCNNDKKHDDHTGHTKKAPQTQEDSLMADVMDGHNVGMGKYNKLQAMEKKVKASLDSIGKLPAKAQQELAPYKAKLDSAAADLSYAIFAMDKWMEEFDMDSARNNLEVRISYLLDEKMKVGKVKEAILNSLAKADSLLKTKL